MPARNKKVLYRITMDLYVDGDSDRVKKMLKRPVAEMKETMKRIQNKLPPETIDGSITMKIDRKESSIKLRR